MNTITATITAETIVLAERNDLGLTCRVIAEEARPGSFADADAFLAFHSYGRNGAWELTCEGAVEASAAPVDNRFNGTVAARLDRAVGTTHDAWVVDQACNVDNGDLVSDMDASAVYVVGGSSTECGTTKLHMVAECKTWADRYTGEFVSGELVRRARRRA